jgi:hypothetical protein
VILLRELIQLRELASKIANTPQITSVITRTLPTLSF